MHVNCLKLELFWSKVCLGGTCMHVRIRCALYAHICTSPGALGHECCECVINTAYFAKIKWE